MTTHKTPPREPTPEMIATLREYVTCHNPAFVLRQVLNANDGARGGPVSTTAAAIAPAPQEDAPLLARLREMAEATDIVERRETLRKAAAAIAEKDAEIARERERADHERRRADMLWQECENLRAGLTDRKEKVGCGICDHAWWNGKEPQIHDPGCPNVGTPT